MRISKEQHPEIAEQDVNYPKELDLCQSCPWNMPSFPHPVSLCKVATITAFMGETQLQTCRLQSCRTSPIDLQIPEQETC